MELCWNMHDNARTWDDSVERALVRQTHASAVDCSIILDPQRKHGTHGQGREKSRTEHSVSSRGGVGHGSQAVGAGVLLLEGDELHAGDRNV